MARLSGRTAIVTGAASGIGRAIAIRLAEEGAKVGIFDINSQGGNETVSMVAAAGGVAKFFEADISSRATVLKRYEELSAEYGAPSILVNNAAWDKYGQFVDSDEEYWDKTIAINLRGPMNLQHVALPGMIANGWGRIINIASDAGRAGTSGQAVYAACKGGIIALTKALALESARSGVTVNVICPGPTDTPLFDMIKAGSERAKRIGESLVRAIPVKRVGKPEDYSGMVAQLACEESSFITGQVISINGGLIMPG
ncbi:SDR family NAD(P)-dependent oxidoreductase [Mesorhizobium sp. A556]